jgi:hypothetical protein
MLLQLFFFLQMCVVVGNCIAALFISLLPLPLRCSDLLAPGDLDTTPTLLATPFTGVDRGRQRSRIECRSVVRGRAFRTLISIVIGTGIVVGEGGPEHSEHLVDLRALVLVRADAAAGEREDGTHGGPVPRGPEPAVHHGVGRGALVVAASSSSTTPKP